MRELTSHKVNGCNEALMVRAMDKPGHGGASHEYQIEFNDDRPDAILCKINFQNGPIAEVGTNGITHEALLAILIDRLEGFQSGKFAHPYNADALTSLRSAQASLQQRTRDRLARGVEGTHQV